MAFGRKVGVGSAWCLLLLAAVLLVSSAAIAGAVEEEERLRGDQRTCELKCQHHQNPENRQRCINYCMRWQVVVPGGVDEEENGAAAIAAGDGEGRYGGTQHMCEIKCQHHKNPVNRQRCIDYCIKWQVVVDGVEEDDGAAAAAAGAIRQVV